MARDRIRQDWGLSGILWATVPDAADLDTSPPVFSLLGGSGLAGRSGSARPGPTGGCSSLMAPTLSEGRSALRERDRALQGMP